MLDWSEELRNLRVQRDELREHFEVVTSLELNTRHWYQDARDTEAFGKDRSGALRLFLRSCWLDWANKEREMIEQIDHLTDLIERTQGYVELYGED